MPLLCFQISIFLVCMDLIWHSRTKLLSTVATEFRFTIQQRTFINDIFIKIWHVKVSQRVPMIQKTFWGETCLYSNNVQFTSKIYLSHWSITYHNISYNETLNNEYIERIYQMSSWQFFNEFYTILRKFQYLRK